MNSTATVGPTAPTNDLGAGVDAAPLGAYHEKGAARSPLMVQNSVMLSPLRARWSRAAYTPYHQAPLCLVAIAIRAKGILRKPRILISTVSKAASI